MVDLQVKYNCKILPLGTFATVAIALNIAMSVMFVSIFIGLHAIISTVLMVGLLMLILMFLSSEATFTIKEILRTKLNKRLFIKYHDRINVAVGHDSGDYMDLSCIDKN